MMCLGIFTYSGHFACDALLLTFDPLNIDGDPKVALTDYIRLKVMYLRDDPDASHIFVSEIVHGAPILNDYLSSDFKIWV